MPFWAPRPAISHEFIFHSEKRSVSCLLEMKYSLSDAEMREFGAYGFANVVCLEFGLTSAQDQGDRTLRLSGWRDVSRMSALGRMQAFIVSKNPALPERAAIATWIISSCWPPARKRPVQC